jgi:hypothetical protein
MVIFKITSTVGTTKIVYTADHFRFIYDFSSMSDEQRDLLFNEISSSNNLQILDKDLNPLPSIVKNLNISLKTGYIYFDGKSDTIDGSWFYLIGDQLLSITSDKDACGYTLQYNYSLDDQSSPLIDDCENENLIVDTGNPYSSFGKAGGSCYTSPDNLAHAVSSNNGLAIHNTTPLSYSFLTYAEYYSGEYNNRILRKVIETPSIIGLTINKMTCVEHRYLFGFGNWTTNERVYIKNGTDLPYETWHHIVCTYDGSCHINGIKIYVDGEYDSTPIIVAGDVIGDFFTNTVPIQLLSENLGISTYKGYLDEFLITYREMQSNEIKQLYNNYFNDVFWLTETVSSLSYSSQSSISSLSSISSDRAYNMILDTDYYVDIQLSESYVTTTKNTYLYKFPLSLITSSTFWSLVSSGANIGVWDVDNEVKKSRYIGSYLDIPNKVGILFWEGRLNTSQRFRICVGSLLSEADDVSVFTDNNSIQYYPLSEQSGTTIWGSSNNLVLYPPTTINNPGKIFKSASYNKLSGSISGVVPLGSGSFSISFITYPLSLGQGDSGFYICIAGSGETRFFVRSIPTNKLNVRPKSGYEFNTLNNSFNISAWNHVVVTVDNATHLCCVYINGSYAAQDSFVDDLLGRDSLYIGNNIFGTATIEGTIEHVNILSDILDVNDVLTLYNMENNAFTFYGSNFSVYSASISSHSSVLSNSSFSQSSISSLSNHQFHH